MADALVAAVIQTAVGMLSSSALQEISHVWGLKDEIDKLESTFATIQIGLHDAELKQRKNEPIQNWLRKLKDAAYDAENILDQMAIEGLRRRANSERGKLHQFKSFLFTGNPLLFRLEMAEKVKNISKKLDAIAEEKHKFNLGEGFADNRSGVSVGLGNNFTSSIVNEPEICGRREEKEEIMAKILVGEGDLCVHAIQGMGGLGKTTLAQMVYNDERSERHFDLRIWVCVSDDFSVAGIVRAILECIEGGGCGISAMEPLQRRLQEKLREKKKYLLVLDDIWNENPLLWDDLKQVLRCGSKGSVIIVTTRIEKIALMMAATTDVHHINYLSEDDSWSLFKQRAFSNGEGEDNLIAIGKAIVKKCGGVPLAIKALGSLMTLKSQEWEWEAIKESEMWHLSDDENAILPALRLSYYNLLPHMRQCFAYCCIFPKDYVMEEERLIRLWMANGYIPSDGPTDMHHSGQLIFKELVWRSFLQDVHRNRRGNMSCKMHDLMHDLASSVMKHETYILEYNKKPQIPKTLRHLSFVSGRSRGLPIDLKLKLRPIDHSLRSVILLPGYVPDAWEKDICPLLAKQKYIRAYDGGIVYARKLQDFICKLEHLRYLVLSCYKMKSLPESLNHLHNLQTLKLTDSDGLHVLPKGLKVMKKLWFLEMESFDSLLCTPPGLRNLTCLRSPSVFIVGKDEPHQIDQIKDLKLGGKLSIQGLDNITSMQEARSANLMTKSNLTCLSLSWKKGMCAQHSEEVLEGLQPHLDIEKISIDNYHGSRFPNWMSTLTFGKLKQIILKECPECEHLPPLGKLPSLTHLVLKGMDSVKCLDTECYGDGETAFPALEFLKVTRMRNLERWAMVDSAKSFPCLERLLIRECPKLGGLPKLPTLNSLEIRENISTILISTMFMSSLISLSDLFIAELPIRAVSNMLDNLSALKTLRIYECHNLEFLPGDFKYLTSLERLDIRNCDGLTSFPTTSLQSLCSLTSLCLRDCKKLKPLLEPLRQPPPPPPLEDLLLYWLPELEYLPENLQLLTSLTCLTIVNCEKLKSLPDGFKDLKSLTLLQINGCPELEKRCEKAKGEDWPKISHIPSIVINGHVIQILK